MKSRLRLFCKKTDITYKWKWIKGKPLSFSFLSKTKNSNRRNWRQRSDTEFYLDVFCCQLYCPQLHFYNRRQSWALQTVWARHQSIKRLHITALYRRWWIKPQMTFNKTTWSHLIVCCSFSNLLSKRKEGFCTTFHLCVWTCHQCTPHFLPAVSIKKKRFIHSCCRSCCCCNMILDKRYLKPMTLTIS